MKRTPEPTLAEVHAELLELRQLILEQNLRAGDLVDAAYVARRTQLKERTILEGKAGTNTIPRISLGGEGKRGLVRFRKADVDRWVDQLARKAEAQDTQRRATRLFILKERT